MRWDEWRLLLSWLFWFGFVVVGSIIAWYEGFIGYLLYSDTTGLTAIIIFISLFSLIWNFKNMVMIQMEISKAYQLAEVLNKETIVFNKEIIVSFKEGVAKNHAIELVKINKNTDDIPSQDNLVEILYARLLLPETYTIYLSSAVTILGFLGTLIGFTMMGNSLMTMMSGDVSMEKAVSGIAQVVSGIRTAINTTVVGLVGYLILSLFHQLVDNATSRLVAKIAEIGEQFILPSLKKERGAG